MIIVPFFPDLRLLLDLLAPLCIYGVWRWVAPRFGLTDPEQRCRLLWWLTFFPLVSRIGIRIRSDWRADLLDSVSLSCGHPYLNKAHSSMLVMGCRVPDFMEHWPLLLVLAIFVLICIKTSGSAFAIGAGALDYFRSALAIHRLPKRAEDGVWILDSPGWTAFTFGLVRPQIFISAEVWRSEHSAAVVAHEYAHVRRRDPLLRFLLHGMRRLFWYFPGWKPILAQAEFEAERVCDRQASTEVGRVRYARALLAFAEHAQSSPALNFGSSFAQHLSADLRSEYYDLVDRARDLANPPREHTSPQFWFWFVPIYILVNIIA